MMQPTIARFNGVIGFLIKSFFQIKIMNAPRTAIDFPHSFFFVLCFAICPSWNRLLRLHLLLLLLLRKGKWKRKKVGSPLDFLSFFPQISFQNVLWITSGSCFSGRWKLDLGHVSKRKCWDFLSNNTLSSPFFRHPRLLLDVDWWSSLCESRRKRKPF